MIQNLATHKMLVESIHMAAWGVCSTSQATAAKTVTISNFSELVAGARFTVKFTNANIVNNPTLNVNGLGAKKLNADNDRTYVKWLSGSVIEFVYDGTEFRIVGGYDLKGMPVNTLFVAWSSYSPGELFGGNWEPLPAGYALWTATSDAGGKIAAGLPNITGERNVRKARIASQEENMEIKISISDNAIAEIKTQLSALVEQYNTAVANYNAAVEVINKFGERLTALEANYDPTIIQ